MSFFSRISNKLKLIQKSTIGNVAHGQLEDDVVVVSQLDKAVANIPVGGIADITYAALVVLKAANGFSEGSIYRITDFKTEYTYVNGAGTCTGAVEPLIVTATSVNTLAPIAYSEDFPNDIIHYDLNAYTNGAEFPYGAIVRRKDTYANLELPFDFRNCKALRYETSVGSGLFYQSTDPGGGEASSVVLCLMTGLGTNVSCLTSSNQPNPDVVFIDDIDDTIIRGFPTSATFVGDVVSSDLYLSGITNCVFYRSFIGTKLMIENGANDENFCGFNACDIYIGSFSGTNVFDITKDFNGVTLKSAGNIYTNINLSAATHVYASSYTKTIGRRVGSQWILSYIDSGSVQQNVAITA